MFYMISKTYSSILLNVVRESSFSSAIFKFGEESEKFIFLYTSDIANFKSICP